MKSQATEAVTIEFALGVVSFNPTESAKVSGAENLLPDPKLRAGFGGLVLCAKSDKPERFLQLAKATGRKTML